MASRTQLEAAARELRPLRQGDLDGLCGLYALVNAISLVVRPFRRLTRAELRTLFDRGLRLLVSARKLRPVMLAGMDDLIWDRLCDELVQAAIELTGLELFRVDLLGKAARVEPHRALALIRCSLRDGWPVTLALMGAYNHTTVVAGFTRTSLRLFDSAGHARVLTRSLSFSDAPAATTHHIPPASVVALLAY